MNAAAVSREAARMPADLRAELDSGDAAFRARDLDGALAHYTAATAIDDGVAAAWFGVYMAQKAKGNADAALQALERVQKLQPGASLVDATARDTTP